MAGLLSERVAGERGCNVQESDPGTKGVTGDRASGRQGEIFGELQLPQYKPGCPERWLCPPTDHSKLPERVQTLPQTAPTVTPPHPWLESSSVFNHPFLLAPPVSDGI